MFIMTDGIIWRTSKEVTEMEKVMKYFGSTKKEDKLEEARALERSGKKHIKCGFFRWSPHWDGAAIDYEKAAMIYKLEGDTENATRLWLDASDAYASAGNDFLAARTLEQLASYLEEQVRKGGENEVSSAEKAADLYERASILYERNAEFYRQAESLKKAAKLLIPTTSIARSSALTSSRSEKEQRDIARASTMFCNAVKTLENHEEEQKQCLVLLLDLYRTWMLLHLRCADVHGAVDVLKQMLGIHDSSKNEGLFQRLQQHHNSSKAGLELIVLCLSCSDIVWAQHEMKKLRNVAGFCGSKEERVAESLLVCFEERDAEKLQEVLKDFTLQFISADISRIAKKLTICSTEITGASGGEKITPSVLQRGQEQHEGLIRSNSEEDLR